MPATAPLRGGTPVLATSYRRPTASTSFCKDGAAPYSTPNSGNTQPHPGCGSKKLLDQFRDKMRAHCTMIDERAMTSKKGFFLESREPGALGISATVDILRCRGDIADVGFSSLRAGLAGCAFLHLFLVLANSQLQTIAKQNERRGTWWQRVLIGAFSILLTLLIYWLLGFVLRDIGRLPGPDWNEFEATRLDADLRTAGQEIEKSISDVKRQIENMQRRQKLLRDSTASSQKTLNQLLELLRISIERQVELPEEQQLALAESQQLFLENQKQDQNYNQTLSAFQEKLADLEEQQRLHRQRLDTAWRPVREEFSQLQRKHDWRLAAIKIGFLTPLLLVGGYLFARCRGGKYIAMIFALDLALLAKVFLVMHEYFPAEYFKYVLILSSLVVIGFLLARLLNMVAEPSQEARLKQAREAYESFSCPVCQFPIRRGPLKFMSWSPRSLRKRSQPIANVADEPYTCPACATALFEKCENCGAIRHGLLPACEHCGAEKEM